MAGHLLSTLELDHIEQTHYFVVVELAERLSVDFLVGYVAPRSDYFVVLLVLELGHALAENIADQSQLLVPLHEQILRLQLLLFHFLLLFFGLLLQVLAHIRLVFFLAGADLLVDLAELHP